MKTRIVLIGAVVLGWAVCTQAGVLVYNAANDFSTNTNPNGAWSYGYSPAGPDGFALYDVHTTGGPIGLPGIDFWATSTIPGWDPNVTHNGTGLQIGPTYGITWAPNALCMSAAGAGGSYIRWTAPVAGALSVDVTFTGVQPANGSNGVYVFDGGPSLVWNSVLDAGGSVHWSQSWSAEQVPPGSILFFAINGVQTVQLDATLTLTTVSEPIPVYWTGIGDTTWSTASGLNNWKDSGGATADYANGAPVTFDDTATGTSVDISAADVSPASVTFNNSSQNFTITGTKGIAGTTGVLKQGTGTVTLNSVNTYTGVTTIQAGTLQMSEYSYGNVATNGGADIQGGKGVLDYSLSGVSPAPEVQAALTASYNGGAWDVGQIRNTTAATTGLTLGWKDDTTASQVTIMATYVGDANLSGTVDVADLTALLNNYNKTGMVWADGNFNYDVDGVVNVADLTALLNNYNKSVGGSVMAGLSVGGSAVPEPGTVVLLSTGLLGLLAYAWRKQK
jgi:autotransporter-associated beta strand protein